MAFLQQLDERVERVQRVNLSANQLVATDGSGTQVSCAVSNANGCSFSVASGGATLNATMTQDLSTSGSPTFVSAKATTSLIVDDGTSGDYLKVIHLTLS